MHNKRPRGDHDFPEAHRVLNLRDQTLVPLLYLHDLHPELLLGGRESLDLLLEPL